MRELCGKTHCITVHLLLINKTRVINHPQRKHITTLFSYLQQPAAHAKRHILRTEPALERLGEDALDGRVTHAVALDDAASSDHLVALRIGV